MSSIPTTTIQNILLTHRKYTNYSNKLPDLESTPESIELLKLERKLSKNLLAIVKFMFKNEALPNRNTKPRLSELKRKYGFLFASVLRATIEEIYRLGGSYGIQFENIPSLTYFTTDADLVLIRQYTRNYHQRIWFRIDKFVLNRLTQVPDASPIKGSFIVNTLAAEIATYVMMESTKEKTRQVLSILDRSRNSSAATQTESASIEPKIGYDDDDLTTLIDYIDPLSPFPASTTQTNHELLGALVGLMSFGSVASLVNSDGNNSSNQKQQYYFMWQTARDDKVCRRYCRPLNGVLWRLDEIDSIPRPDQLTHPFCRCRIIKVMI